MELILGTVDISVLKKAFSQLDAAIVEAKSDLEKAGAIQYFEYTYELSWKILRKILAALGQDPANNPRTIFRQAAQSNLITNPETWFSFIEYRNKTVHTYDEEVAEEIFRMLPDFRDEVASLIHKLEQLS